MEPEFGIRRWVDADDEIKLLILKDAKILRPRPWPTISRMIEDVYDVRVSHSCLLKRLTPGAMEKNRANTRRYSEKYPKRRKEQVRRYWETHRDRLLLRRKMLEGKIEWAVV